ncbi:MAG: glycosyltransferase family 2 protein [Planctomycetota bacterium]|jgi:glycosyltransferase involved in cell wall biosynthesis
MLKLIIQIPCFNEEEALPATLADLPREIEGFERVEYLVVDDGSRDDTARVAREAGVDHIVRLNGNHGLARAFMAGVLAAVCRGADVIVNTDADNQYNAADIPRLVEPILQNRADIVVGARPIDSIAHFSPLKRFLQRLGSHVARTLSNTEVRDAPSGFRAMTRDAALRLNVFGNYTYTLETVIQAGRSNLRIVDVPIRVNGPTRPSRLIRNMFQYVRRSVVTMCNAYLIYRPMPVFAALAMSFLVPAFALAVRYLYLAFVLGSGTGHVQSVIASGVLAVCGVLIIAIGFVAHLLGINRRLIEEVRYLTLVAQHGKGQGQSKLGAPESLSTADVAMPIRQPHRPRETEVVAGDLT